MQNQDTLKGVFADGSSDPNISDIFDVFYRKNQNQPKIEKVKYYVCADVVIKVKWTIFNEAQELRCEILEIDGKAPQKRLCDSVDISYKRSVSDQRNFLVNLLKRFGMAGPLNEILETTYMSLCIMNNLSRSLK